MRRTHSTPLIILLLTSLTLPILMSSMAAAMPPRVVPYDENGQPVAAGEDAGKALPGQWAPGLNGPAPLQGPPTTGTANIPVICIRFPTQPFFQSTANFFNMLFSLGTFPTGSMNDYWREVSYNNLSVFGQVDGWHTASQPEIFYVNFGGGMLNTYPRNSQGLVREAVLAADATLNFSQFDNDGPDNIPNSGDDDGFVDCVMVIFNGYAAESYFPANTTNEIQSHFYWLGAGNGPGPISVDGVQVNQYSVQSELRGTGGFQIRDIGVFCHEFGHALGLPDLYSTCPGALQPTLGAWSGLGTYDLMAFGGWGAGGANPDRPHHLSGYCKAFLGWASPIHVTVDQLGASIPTVETNGTIYCSFPFWNSPGQDINPPPGSFPPSWTMYPPPIEGFVVENRQQVGFDAGLPGSGLLIYHVDGNVAQGDIDANGRPNLWDNAVQWSENNPMIDLECADQVGADHTFNADDLDAQNNLGDANDYFRLGFNSFFDASSNPSNAVMGPWSSPMQVQNISASGATMTADLIVGVPAGPVHDVYVRDCQFDDASVPSTPNCNYPMFRQQHASPDVWIDNDRDGLMDRPVSNCPNRVYVRVHNNGPQPIDFAKVRLYDLSQWLAPPPPIGGPPNNPFWSNVQVAWGQPQSILPGTSQTIELWWFVPPVPPFNFPPSLGLYVDTANDVLGPSAMVAFENNLAIRSGKDLYCNAGWAPPPKRWTTLDSRTAAGAPGDRSQHPTQDPLATPATFFLPFNNPYEFEREITLDWELDLPPDWTISLNSLDFGPMPIPFTTVLPPLHESPIEVVIDPGPFASQGDTGQVTFLEYDVGYPSPDAVIGSMELPVEVDVRGPVPPTNVKARLLERDSDVPWVQCVDISWEQNSFDIEGDFEDISHFYVLGDSVRFIDETNPDLIWLKIAKDADDTTPEWNYYDYQLPQGPLGSLRYYAVIAVDEAGNRSELSASVAATGIDGPGLAAGGELLLRANSPNPFGSSTTLSYVLPQSGHVRLRVYDVRGRLVNTLVDETQAAGERRAAWNGRDVAGRRAASGVYFARLEASNVVRTKKMLLER